MLAVVIVGLFAFAAGLVIGRGDARREQRQSTVVLQPHRLYSAWSKGDRKS